MESCNRIEIDEAVNVRQMERYAGDHGNVTPEPLAQREERVAIVGSGPAGLTAAYHLARFGYRVKVFESGPEIGGLLRTGIPGFRLPEDVVAREIERIIALGIDVETDHRIDRQALLSLTRDHDAVLVATGQQAQRDLQLGMNGTEAVVQGIDFLDHVHRADVRVDGEDVIVVGGGNTAMDAARSALRLGANSVRVVYRRSRDEMPAIREEIDDARHVEPLLALGKRAAHDQILDVLGVDARPLDQRLNYLPSHFVRSHLRKITLAREVKR